MASLYSYMLRTYMNYNKPPGSAAARPLEELRAAREEAAERLSMPGDFLVQPVTAGGVEAEWVHPREAPKEKIIMYLHGGAYVMGSCDTHRPLAARVARACGMRGLLLAYRLAPEHPFPAAVEDVVAAYRWLLYNRFKSGDIVFVGDSTGCGLVLAALLSLRDAGEPLPAAAVCLTPWIDLAPRKILAGSDPCLSPQTLDLASHYVGGNDPSQALLSPLHADLSGLPPLLIQAGGDDLLLDDATRLAERARAAGVDVTLEQLGRMWHEFHHHAPKLPEAREAIAAVGSFVRRTLGGGIH